MCAKLLACPLCSQPGFLTLDALRAGLISVATRPLMCPVCNEVLFGIDKLTIHLFSHTLNLNNNVMEQPKQLNTTAVSNEPDLVLSYNLQDNTSQDWSASNRKTQSLESYKTGECSNMITHDVEASKSVMDKEKDKASTLDLEICLEQQNMIAKSVSQVVFLTDQTYDVGRRNILQEYYNNSKIMLEPCKSSQDVVTENENGNHDPQYSSNNVKDIDTLEMQSKTDQDSVDSVKKWIQSQQSEEPSFSGDMARFDTDRESILAAVSGSSSNKLSDTLDAEKLILTKECKLTNCELIPNTSTTSLHNELESFNSKETVNDSQLHSNTDQQTTQEKGQQDTAVSQLNSCQILVTKDKTERCNICGFQFSDYNILLLHKQLVHMISDKDLDATPEDLFRNYSCHLCSKVFKMRGSLMVHMRVAHTGCSLGPLSKTGQVEFSNNEKGFSCPTCGKKFKKEQHVVQHLKTHEGKQWECDVCNKMFTTKYFLKKHKRLHSGEMPYKCTICDKTFTFQQSYHKHRLYHKDDKPHTCTTCGRSFKELSTLHNHERIHTGEKPFACETCGKCFRQRVSYLVHRRIHTGVMPYKCTACGKSFRYKVSQRTHKCPMQQVGTIQQSTESNPNLEESKNSQETSVSLENTMVNDMDSEKNKYVLIINPQGQHLLAREAEIENTQASVSKPVTMAENLMLMALSDKPTETAWSSNIPINNIFTDVQETLNKASINTKKREKVATDFFTMVVPPLENGLSTPTNEMKQLHVSSPMQTENVTKSYESFKQNSNDVELGINTGSLHDNYNETNDDHNCLQTINEESLKELLYGIHDK